MVLEGALEGRLASHISGETNAVGVEAGGDGDSGAFLIVQDASGAHEAGEGFAATAMNHAGRGANFFIGKGGDILLEKIDQAAVLLEDGKDEKAGGVGFFLGRGFGSGGFRRRRFGEQTRQLGGESGIAQNLEGKAQAGKEAGRWCFLISHTGEKSATGPASCNMERIIFRLLRRICRLESRRTGINNSPVPAGCKAQGDPLESR